LDFTCIFGKDKKKEKAGQFD
jgi:hypothetical protein